MANLKEIQEESKTYLKQYGTLSEAFLQRKFKINFQEARKIMKLLMPEKNFDT